MEYEKNDLDQIQFRRFEKGFCQRRIGYTGFYQHYNQNGQTIQEGYRKDSKVNAELKMFSNNKVKYGKMIPRDAYLWY